MTTNNYSLDVVGVGMYLEMRRSTASMSYVSQMIVMPEITRPDVAVPMTMLNRRLSQAAPKKTWSRFSSSSMSGKILGSANEIVQQMTGFIQSSMDRHVTAGYKSVGYPIFFEVTREDAFALRDLKTPYKIIGRINKGRKALGYPEELIPAPPVSASVPSTTPAASV